MEESTSRFWEIFFELYESLPRQGPGSRTSTTRALTVCHGLPTSPVVLDLGCGTGAQTLHLGRLTTGRIVAVDSHAPSIRLLGTKVLERGLAGRIQPLVGDIGRPSLAPGSFDLIWAEGSLYNIGIERALRLYHPVLRSGGFLAFTDAVWRKQDPPPEIEASFADYAGMGGVRDVLRVIGDSEFLLVDHFTLPDEDWWEDFYEPMVRRISEMRGKYADDAEALTVLGRIAQEPDLHRRYSDWYAYEFFVVRRR
jgi:SAM-dependent methyltransferase